MEKIRLNTMRIDKSDLDKCFDSKKKLYDLTNITTQYIQLILDSKGSTDIKGKFITSKETKSLFFVNHHGKLKVNIDDQKVDVKSYGVDGDVQFSGSKSLYNKNIKGNVESIRTEEDVKNYNIQGNVENKGTKKNVYNEAIYGSARNIGTKEDIENKNIEKNVSNIKTGGNINNE
ncbi:MAG: hypothetical protein CR971_02425, partial [candidate division SR1 bacterium]